METEDEELAADATPLCTGCMRPVEGNPDFCPYCNAPLGLTTQIVPYSRARSLGSFYRQGTRRPTSPMILLGMAILLGGFLAEGVALIALPVATSDWTSAGMPLIGILLVAIGGTGMFKVFQNYARLRAQRKTHPLE